MHVPPDPGIYTDISIDGARIFAVPESRLYKDQFNGRWIVYYKPHGSFSRSWQCSSEAVALATVLQWSWRKCAVDNGFQSPWAWIDRLAAS